MVDRVKTAKYATLPTFVKIDGTIVELWRFNNFSNGGHPPSWIFKCAYGSEGQCASLCKILCWSVKWLLRYCDF